MPENVQPAAGAPACLLSIDWQRGFEDVAHWGGERNNPQAEERAAALLAHWRARGWPVHHVQHASSDPRSPLHPACAGHAFMPFAAPRESEPVHVKQVNSAFIGTGLEAALREAGIVQLVVCGLTTDHCVSTTVRMAANLGFEVVLAADACATFARQGPDGAWLSAEEVHRAHVASLHGEFATAMSCNAIMARFS